MGCKAQIAAWLYMSVHAGWQISTYSSYDLCTLVNTQTNTQTASDLSHY